jgi:hypothetical protein
VNSERAGATVGSLGRRHHQRQGCNISVDFFFRSTAMMIRFYNLLGLTQFEHIR